jgi:hypothetical protein
MEFPVSEKGAVPTGWLVSSSRQAITRDNSLLQKESSYKLLTNEITFHLRSGKTK